MKIPTNFYQASKALVMAGLLATLATKASAQARVDDHWSPLDTFTDGSGNTYAYWDDANNWSLTFVPGVVDTSQSGPAYDNAAFDDNATAPVYCIVTNTTQVTAVGQLMAGFGGGGTLVISNNAHFQAGFAYGGNWTGIGFVAGPGTLIVEPGADFTCASHLWVGQGTADQGTVIINGGTLHIPNGQLGVSWNGIGGTNSITITNGGALYMSQWSSQTLGAPGSGAANFGIMNIADSASQVVITNNQLSYMNTLETNNQLIAFGGAGTIQAVYNPTLNITVLSGLAPAGAPTPLFSVQPTSQVVALNGTATLTATASPATGYQWLFNSAPLADGNGISGTKTATLTIQNFNVAETGVYSVIATNSAGNPQYRLYATSASATLTAQSVNLYPVVTINGVNGSTYVVQSTTSLNPPVTWTSFSTNTVGAGPAYIVDTTSPLSVKKFYQVILQ
jgi:hypothetical protein